MSVNIEVIKKVIGIPNFKQIDLLQIALTYPSYIYENRRKNRQQQELQAREYRRLALLGDAFFNAVVIGYLYDRLPNFNQGKLTTWKSDLVSRNQAYKFSQMLNLSHHCLLGASERGKHDLQQNLFAEMFEALLGAIYLEFQPDFSRFRNWLVDGFVGEAFDDLLSGMTDQELVEAGLEDLVLTFPYDYYDF